jgi:hypothetical protein
VVGVVRPYAGAGFDVPIFRDGTLGVPIPTFERLEHLTLTKPVRTAGVVSTSPERYKIEEAALESLLEKKPEVALLVMSDVMASLNAKEFDAARSAVQAAIAAS